MKSTRSRTLAKMITAGVFTAALMGVGATAAHAEMFDVPIQSQAESDLSAGAVPFNRMGSVPPSLVGEVAMVGLFNDAFVYVSAAGYSIPPNDFERLNSYKNGNCVVLGNYEAAACDG